MFLALLAAASMLTSGPSSACVRSSLSNNSLQFSGTTDAEVIAQVESQLRTRGWTVYTMTDDGKGNWSCSGTYVFSVVINAIPAGSARWAFSIGVRGYIMSQFPSISKQGYAEAWSSLGIFSTDGTAAEFQSNLPEYVSEVASSIE